MKIQINSGLQPGNHAAATGKTASKRQGLLSELGSETTPSNNVNQPLEHATGCLPSPAGASIKGKRNIRSATSISYRTGIKYETYFSFAGYLSTRRVFDRFEAGGVISDLGGRTHACPIQTIPAFAVDHPFPPFPGVWWRNSPTVDLFLTVYDR